MCRLHTLIWGSLRVKSNPLHKLPVWPFFVVGVVAQAQASYRLVLVVLDNSCQAPVPLALPHPLLT